MWVFTKYGFVSAACALKQDGTIDPNTLMLRARSRQHLENLKERFPESELATAEILSNESTDYKYRMIVSKTNWAAVLSELAMEQTWSNFKNESARFANLKKMAHDYVDALHDIWSIMHRFGNMASGKD